LARDSSAVSPSDSDSSFAEGLRALSVEQILDFAPDAMLIVGVDGEIVYLNALAGKLFGYESKELLGRSVESLVPVESRPLHAVHRQGYFQQPRVRMMETGLELYGLRKDGSRFPIEISLSPLTTPAGTLVLGAVRDRTRKQQVEQEIRNLNRNLQAKVEELDCANRELEEFTYTTAHDLRAPVRHMQGFAELLRQSAAGRLNDPEIRDLDRIIVSAKRLGLLIDALLDFSRIGRLALNLQPVNLTRLVEEVQAAVEKDFPGRRVLWRTSGLPEIAADRGALRILLTRLLDNALKFTRAREKAVIETGCLRQNGAATIFVRDNGVGFDMQYAANLFQIFQRLHRADEFEGTGIGLAAVRRIAERHGGKVWAESEPGKGATFYVSLPQGGPHP
jgi:PAS domain S-box-containing protein